MFTKTKQENIAAEEIMTTFIFMAFTLSGRHLGICQHIEMSTFLNYLGSKKSSDHYHQQKGEFSIVSRILWPLIIQTEGGEYS